MTIVSKKEKGKVLKKLTINIDMFNINENIKFFFYKLINSIKKTINEKEKIDYKILNFILNDNKIHYFTRKKDFLSLYKLLKTHKEEFINLCNQENKFNDYPINIAIDNNNFEIFKLLFNYTNKQNLKIKKKSKINSALLKYFEKYNIKTNKFSTYFHQIINNNNEKFINYIFDYIVEDIQCEYTKETYLSLLILNNNFKYIKRFLDNLNIKINYLPIFENNNTIFHYIKYFENKYLLFYLFIERIHKENKDFNILMRENNNFETPINYLSDEDILSILMNSNIEITKKLIKIPRIFHIILKNEERLQNEYFLYLGLKNKEKLENLKFLLKVKPLKNKF